MDNDKYAFCSEQWVAVANLHEWLVWHLVLLSVCYQLLFQRNGKFS